MKTNCKPQQPEIIKGILNFRISTLKNQRSAASEGSQPWNYANKQMKLLQGVIIKWDKEAKDESIPVCSDQLAPTPLKDKILDSVTGLFKRDCPCLEDLDIIKKLVLLISAILGATSNEQVRKIIRSYSLEDILGNKNKTKKDILNHLDNMLGELAKIRNAPANTDRTVDIDALKSSLELEKQQALKAI